MPQISKHAIVEPTARLADDVRIGPFSYVGPDVRVGSGCVIDNNVTIVGRTVLGDRTRVFPLAVIGAPAPHENEPGECILGEANAVREHVTIYSGIDSPTRIGNHNLIMIASQIGSGAIIGDHGIFDNYVQIGPHSYVEDYVRMSGFAAVGPGVKVGAYCFIAGYTRVDDDTPPYAMIQGFPVRVRGVNTRNLQVCGFGQSDIHALKAAFRELFNGRGSDVNEQVLQRMEADVDLNQHVRRLTKAIRSALETAGERSDD
jgi:UDP-N-acetylglucosamine acyltransferase